MKEKIKIKIGFIRSPLLIAIIIGILVISGGSYFGVKQYRNYQAKQTEGERMAQEISKRLEGDDIYKKVSPAVVFVETDKAMGSGIIIDSNGLILTNAHVVAEAESVKIKYNDKLVNAFVLGRDEKIDLALLKIDLNNLPTIELGDSDDLQRGEKLYAFGYPVGISGEVTMSGGIFSARQEDEGINYIQTDAPIHPGNSGGPLINDQAQVIGINTLAALANEEIGGVGLGFAIPINLARDYIPALKAGANVVMQKKQETVAQNAQNQETVPPSNSQMVDIVVTVSFGNHAPRSDAPKYIAVASPATDQDIFVITIFNPNSRQVRIGSVFITTWMASNPDGSVTNFNLFDGSKIISSWSSMITGCENRSYNEQLISPCKTSSTAKMLFDKNNDLAGYFDELIIAPNSKKSLILKADTSGLSSGAALSSELDYIKFYYLSDTGAELEKIYNNNPSINTRHLYY